MKAKTPERAHTVPDGFWKVLARKPGARAWVLVGRCTGKVEAAEVEAKAKAGGLETRAERL